MPIPEGTGGGRKKEFILIYTDMKDKDLDFLSNCSNENIKLLADFMVYDSDGKERITQELTVKQSYRVNYPNNMVAILPDIVDEFQRFGGNTITNKFLGHGAPYRKILEDVCKKLKVPFNKSNTTELLEQYLLQQFLVMSADKMTEEDIHQLSSKLTKEAFKRQLSLLKAGSPLFIRLTTMLIANLAKSVGLKQAAGLAAKFAGGRAFAVLAGPIGWVLSSLWAAYDIAGPAYRVTIPCTLTIAYLRMTQNMSEDELEEILK